MASSPEAAQAALRARLGGAGGIERPEPGRWMAREPTAYTERLHKVFLTV